MTGYVARRIVQMAAVLLGVSVILFAVLFVVPGDPVDAVAGEGPRVDDATRARIHERYHLDDPLPSQYAHWLSGLLQGDLGESYRLRRPVTEILGEKLGNSLDLALAAIVCEAAIGVAAGLLAAAFRRSFLGTLVTVATTAAIAIPAFVVALTLQQVFAVRLGWLPLHGRNDGLRSIVLPALTLGALHAAMVSRLVKASLLEVLSADYIRTARAKGLACWVVVVKHAMRNSLVPVVTYLGVGLGGLLGGAAIVEVIFNWDGIGRAMVTAITAQDNPVVLGVVVYSVVTFVLVNLIVDVVYAAIDPRVRIAGRSRP